MRQFLKCFLITSWITIGFHSSLLYSQNNDAGNDMLYVKEANDIINKALTERTAYTMLAELTSDVGARLSGSPAAAAAVEWARQTMIKHGLEKVHLQEVMVPHWVRGEIEEAAIINSPTVGTRSLAVTALGGSISTPDLGVINEVIEVQSFEAVRALGSAAKGKIIFYNRPMDPLRLNTFSAYGAAVDQRGRGAIEAAKVGAAAVLVRSMTTRLDKVPHTGGMRYEEGVRKIPAAAISTVDANLLSELIKQDSKVRIRLRLSCETLPDVPSANVIGEITGSERPNEVILLGGHLDSWDKGQGAHDDGAGCVQAIEALRLIKELELRPRRTVRAVLFMNEENGLRGGRKYAELVAKDGPKHLGAIESDRGGFAPRGISVQADAGSAIYKSVSRWAYLLSKISDNPIITGFGGADIGPLHDLGVTTMGLMVDSHRYFDYHHSDSDTFDKVNERELELGAATMAIMAYVLAMEGI
ncbi:M20/M25/M40 family metallo-hydrolase [bacterium]|nr:M20/M25/M40 family metallo-hydrolase [bacterium]